MSIPSRQDLSLKTSISGRRLSNTLIQIKIRDMKDISRDS